MITVKVEGVKELSALFKRAPKIAKKVIRKAVRKSAYLVENLSVQEAPHDTGDLRKSIETDLSRINNFRAEVEPKMEYAEIVHEGHGEIRPRRAKVLAVRSSRMSPRARAKYSSRSRNGWIIFGKRVRPVKANRYMTRGKIKAEPRIKRIFEKARTEIIKKLTRKR